VVCAREVAAVVYRTTTTVTAAAVTLMHVDVSRRRGLGATFERGPPAGIPRV
jgi:hypothetical protein